MPTAAELAPNQLLFNLRAHLVAEGVVRLPSVAGALPPLWLDPRNGVPAPGEAAKPAEDHADVVLGAFQVTGIPKRPHEQQYLRIDAVDIWIRARMAPFAYEIDRLLLDALADRRDFMLGALRVVECLQFRPLQRIGSDENAYDFTTQYTFERYA